MDTARRLLPKGTGWKVLSRAAILEADKTLIPQRLSEAAEAVLARKRELFYVPGDPEEQEALKDALYALRALKSAAPCEGANAGPLVLLLSRFAIRRDTVPRAMVCCFVN
jgi:hypothetical protein